MRYLDSLLSQDEQVVFRTRPHWTAFLGRVWRLLLLALVAAAVAVFLNLVLRRIMPSLAPEQELYVRAGTAIVLLIYPALSLITRYWQWRTEQYVVTNLKVIQVSGILAKKVLDSSLEKVNDVMLSQSLLGRMLDYGDLEILTASELAVNKFGHVGKPVAFKTAMLNAKQELESGRGAVDDPMRLITELARLREQDILSDEEFEAKKADLLSKM